MINLREMIETETIPYPNHTVIETTFQLGVSTSVSKVMTSKAKVDLVGHAQNKNLYQIYNLIYGDLEKELINLIQEIKITDFSRPYLHGKLIEHAQKILEMIESTHAKPEPEKPNPPYDPLFPTHFNSL